MSKNSSFKMTPVAAAVTSALLLGASNAAIAQDEEIEEIITVGIRGSLQSNMNIKRNATGVVDAVTATDIGAFPDTNLAESLQRIPGVSIDRVNGEGSKVTVRGFGPGFNLVTLNGRVMPTATIGITGQRDNYTGAQGRSFGFENIASDNVAGLEVYKTGQAVLASGGIGATVNILTHKPLDRSESTGSISAKAIADTSVGDGSSVTPEISGLYNWRNDEGTFGIGVSASYAERDSGSSVGQANDWVVNRYPANWTSFTRSDGSTTVTNQPSAGDLYAIPQDSRYDWSNITRERLNGQLVLQFRPTDSVEVSVDYTFVENSQTEMRAEQTNWFATPFDQLTFDPSGALYSATFMQENNDGTKDIGFEQTNRATKESIDSVGLNFVWDVSDSGTLEFDAHSSSAEALPDNPLGHTATFVTFGAPVIVQHSVDWSAGFPVQRYTWDDSQRGNDNGVLDVGDLATQVQRSSAQTQTMDVDEMNLSYTMDVGDFNITAGANLRDTDVFVSATTTQQDLGSWGMSFPGDLEQYAPGVAEAYCLACQFNDFPVGDADTAFRGDAAVMFPLLQAAYPGNSVSTNSSQNTVAEKIESFYAQVEWNGEWGTKPVQINAGVRYEKTTVDSAAFQAVPIDIRWTADNDFVIDYAANNENVSGSGSYSNTLPNLDIKMDLTDNFVTRFSFSKTIGRVPFSNLFAATTAGAPNRPTALGGQTGGNSEDPSLLPLESTNFDLSFEYYYGDSSYVSIGYFDKSVENFLGTGVFNRPLFGLLDPTSGAAGSRSGDALDVINTLGVDQSEAHLFTLVALIDANGGDVGAAQAEFEANLVNGVLPQTYVDQIAGLYDVSGDANDPEMDFRVTQPINQEKGNIDGWELAVQHFFGDSGFGVAANYTKVSGDVKADPGQDPDENQFALVGLSDSANLTLIYENYGWSARLAYNWRDEFLNATNQGGSRSPQYTDAFGQIDVTVNYDINDNLQVGFEAINLNAENTRQFRRKANMVVWAYELEPRYSIGARYRF